MKQILLAQVILSAIVIVPQASAQQLAPGMGYMSPSGGQAGQTIDVTIGGYDWTSDIELFVHDSRITLELIEPPGEVIVPEPPYWFGKKARRSPFLLPREATARLTIPSDIPPGLVKWQVANANGASATGLFRVSQNEELSEQQAMAKLLHVSEKPFTISGQIKKIQEIDCYEFIADRAGLITCTIESRSLNSPLNAFLEIRDKSDQVIGDVADTGGNDTSLTFLATKDQRYKACLYDVDFRGNRSFVYRLGMQFGPRVVATIPAAVQEGGKRKIDLRGYGLITGQNVLESVVRDIEIPEIAHDSTVTSFDLPSGETVTRPLRISHHPELSEIESNHQLTVPSAVTGTLEQRYGEDVYLIEGHQGDVWQIDLEAAQIHSPLDGTLAITDLEQKELTRSDDLPGTTDAGIEWKVPADGAYRIVVSDVSGHSGSKTAIYRLAVRESVPRFELSAPEFLGVPLGGKTTLSLKVKRAGGFQDSIALSCSELPEGVSVPERLVIPEGKSDLKIELTSAGTVAATARLVTFRGETLTEDRTINAETEPVLIATTLKPPFSIDAEGKDDVTKWPRGSTFPAPVLIEREPGFEGDIVLEMTSKQGRHRQGIRGPELRVPPKSTRVLYPVFLPEWLETTRTSRMVVNGVAQIADPKGNIRYVLSKQKTRMGFLPIGALLKVSTSSPEIETKAGQPVSLAFELNRSSQLTEPVRLELSDPHQVILEHRSLPEINEGVAKIDSIIDSQISIGEYPIVLRATVLIEGQFPVVSECRYLIVVER